MFVGANYTYPFLSSKEKQSLYSSCEVFHSFVSPLLKIPHSLISHPASTLCCLYEVVDDSRRFLHSFLGSLFKVPDGNCSGVPTFISRLNEIVNDSPCLLEGCSNGTYHCILYGSGVFYCVQR